MKICLTGGIACGKSLLSHYLNELGVATCDADDIVHELIPADERKRLAATVFTDPAARRALEARIHPLVRDRIDAWLGEEEVPGAWCLVPGADGPSTKHCDEGNQGNEASGFVEIKESAFSSARSQRLRLLDGLPPIAPGTKHQAPSTTVQLRCAVIPLLFEVQWEADYDIIVCVASSRDKQIERMVTTRGYTRAEAEARLAAQLPVEEKAKKSHYVISNDGSADDLRQEAVRFVNWLRSKING